MPIRNNYFVPHRDENRCQLSYTIEGIGISFIAPNCEKL